MLILGINAFHPDAACCVIRDGKVVAAAEEERFNRHKHYGGFPARALEWCLRDAGATIEDVDYIGFPRNPRSNAWRRIQGFFRFPRRTLQMFRDRPAGLKKVFDLKTLVAQALDRDPAKVRAKVIYVEHHLAHLASAFFASGLERAACLSLDAFGDYASTMWATGEGNRLRLLDRILFPDSLGVFYTAICQWLGFPRFGDEGKVMALASFGQPAFLQEMERLVPRGRETGIFHLALPFFAHHTRGVNTQWGSESPALGSLCDASMERMLGPARLPGAAMEQRHKDTASSLQKHLEACVLDLLNRRLASPGTDALCVAGGVAYNCVLNGRIADDGGFKRLFVQPAAGDSGAALGAALFIAHQVLGLPRGPALDHVYWGPAFSDREIERALNAAGLKARRAANIAEETAAEIDAGRIVGWFQGRMEFGPRALGNRSIVADPRRPDIKERLNLRIKHREPFRPFAPSILEEHVGEYFERAGASPFMIVNNRVRPEKVAVIPAATHVDGTGRLQSVSRAANPRYWDLIEAFRRRTSVPLILNTSFNENEPVVCSPEDAIRCFTTTSMDVLVLGDWIVRREAGEGASPAKPV